MQRAIVICCYLEFVCCQMISGGSLDAAEEKGIRWLAGGTFQKGMSGQGQPRYFVIVNFSSLVQWRKHRENLLLRIACTQQILGQHVIADAHLSGLIVR